MSGEPTLDAQIFRPIRDSVKQMGGPIEMLLQESQLPPLDDEVEELSEARVWEFFDRSARALDQPQIGLLTGAELKIRDLGPFGLQLEHRLTVRDCLEFYVRQVNAHSSHARFWFVADDHGVWFCRGGIDLIDVGRDFVEQFTVQLMIRIVQLGVGSNWVPPRIRLQTANSDLYRDFAPLAPTEFQFSQPCTAILISRQVLACPVRRDSGDRILTGLRECIARDLEQAPRIELTARTLGFSKRTLQRELSQAGISWSRLVDQVRLDTAVRMLNSPEFKLIHVAERLGYTDPSNFARAFTRWTGMSPRNYRDEMADRG